MDPFALPTQRQFIMTMGKGGVGKTTISAALALAAARRGRRVWLVEDSHSDVLAPLFGADVRKGPAAEVEVAENVWVSNLDARGCFRSYVSRSLKSKALTKVLFGNKLVDLFLDALPGFDEVLILNEMFEATESGRYDLVVFDAPATGHGVNILKTPKILSEMVRGGPVHNLSALSHERLTDASRSLLVPVTLGEVMPITETAETIEGLRDILDLSWAPVIVNQVAEVALEGAQLEEVLSRWQGRAPAELLKGLIRLHSQARVNREAVLALRERLGCEAVELPRIADLGHADAQRNRAGLEALITAWAARAAEGGR